MKRLIGFSSLSVSAIIYASFGVWIRLLDKELSINQQIVFRNLIAFAIAILIFSLTKQIKNIKLKNVKKTKLILYTLLIPTSVIAYNVSIINTKIALATFSFYIGTIFTGLIVGVITYKEKIDIKKYLSLVLVLIGLILFTYPLNKGSINLGFLAGLISGVIDGYTNGLRKDLSKVASKQLLVLLTTIGGIFVSGLMVLYFHENLNFISSISWQSWIVGLFFGSSLIIVNYLLLLGFQNFDISLGSIVLSLELVFVLVFGILMFGEYPSNQELLGGVFILLASIIPNIKISIKNK